tara:strand:+ start:637 stop:978 length:342 start_codon:yes stop_codon:yes gene_type:complete
MSKLLEETKIIFLDKEKIAEIHVEHCLILVSFDAKNILLGNQRDFTRQLIPFADFELEMLQNAFFPELSNVPDDADFELIMQIGNELAPIIHHINKVLFSTIMKGVVKYGKES